MIGDMSADFQLRSESCLFDLKLIACDWEDFYLLLGEFQEFKILVKASTLH